MPAHFLVASVTLVTSKLLMLQALTKHRRLVGHMPACVSVMSATWSTSNVFTLEPASILELHNAANSLTSAPSAQLQLQQSAVLCMEGLSSTVIGLLWPCAHHLPSLPCHLPEEFRKLCCWQYVQSRSHPALTKAIFPQHCSLNCFVICRKR